MQVILSYSYTCSTCSNRALNHLQNALDCLCCKEIQQCVESLARSRELDTTTGCVTMQPEFSVVCLKQIRVTTRYVFSTLIPIWNANFWSLIPNVGPNFVPDPTNMAQPDPWSLKKTADPDPMVCDPWSQGCDPRSHPSDPWSHPFDSLSHIPRYDPDRWSLWSDAAKYNGIDGRKCGQISSEGKWEILCVLADSLKHSFCITVYANTRNFCTVYFRYIDQCWFITVVKIITSLICAQLDRG